jgi:predicted amino acid-binding ACT domain protein
MANPVRIVEYYYTKVEDKPGEARRLLGVLSSHGVDLVNITIFPLGDGFDQVDFFPKDPATLVAAAKEAKVELIGPKKAFVFQGADHPGILVDIHLKLAYAGVNIIASNGTGCGRGHFGFVLWVRDEDFEKAARALGA